MQDILEKEENSIDDRGSACRDFPIRVWPHAGRYLHAGWPGRDPETVSRYVKKEKSSFVAYRVHRLPRTKPGGGAFCTVHRRRLSTVRVSPKVPVLAGLGYVPVETMRTFIELLQLPGGWNSYNAKQIRKQNVTAALNLLDRIMRPGTPAPIVVPTVRGGVQLEWHTKGINLEIAIDSEDDISFFAEDIRTGEVPEDLNESLLTEWIDRISTR